MNTQKQHLQTHSLPGVNSKTVAAIMVILIVLFAGIMYLSSNNTNTGKNNSTPAIVPPMGTENTTPAGVDDNSPEDNPEDNTGVNEEVIPVKELTGYENVGVEEYMSVPHDCYLEGSNPSAQNAIGYISEQHKIDGKKFYLSKISVKKGMEGFLKFSLLFRDDNGIEQTWLEFKSTSVEEVPFRLLEGNMIRRVTYFSYSGCLTNPNDTEYKRCAGRNGGITAVENSPETGGFALEGTSFSSDKKEIGGSEIDSGSFYRLVIKHD